MPRAGRVALCQIPPNIVNAMSTEDLLASVLDYPFMIDMLAFSSMRDGFLHVYEEFPALQALLQRDDFASLAAKQFMEVREGTSANDLVKAIYMGVLMEQPEVYEKLDATDYATLHSKANVPIIHALATVLTPNGTAVSVIDNRSITDWTLTEKMELNIIWGNAYPGATRLANPSKKYNCHSYAWYLASTSNYYWMNNPSAYMTDGSYHQYQTVIKAGDKAYWNNGSHSGIVAGVGAGGLMNIRFISKWGSLGVYNHFPWDCPYSGSISTWRP